MKRAFTLVEVIIVTAVIAILAAVIFPVFASAKKQAHVTDCANNQKQIGLALQVYAADYDGWVPPYGTTTVRSANASILGRPVEWRNSLAAYAGKNTDIFWCHLDPHKGTAFMANGESIGLRAQVTSFQLGDRIMMPGLTGDRDGNLNLNIDIGVSHPNITLSPSKTVYLADAFWASGKTLPDNTLEMVNGHNGRENRLYLDGHVVNKNIADE